MKTLIAPPNSIIPLDGDGKYSITPEGVYTADLVWGHIRNTAILFMALLLYWLVGRIEITSSLVFKNDAYELGYFVGVLICVFLIALSVFMEAGSERRLKDHWAFKMIVVFALINILIWVVILIAYGQDMAFLLDNPLLFRILIYLIFFLGLVVDISYDLYYALRERDAIGLSTFILMFIDVSIALVLFFHFINPSLVAVF